MIMFERKEPGCPQDWGTEEKERGRKGEHIKTGNGAKRRPAERGGGLQVGRLGRAAGLRVQPLYK